MLQPITVTEIRRNLAILRASKYCIIPITFLVNLATIAIGQELARKSSKNWFILAEPLHVNASTGGYHPIFSFGYRFEEIGTLELFYGSSSGKGGSWGPPTGGGGPKENDDTYFPDEYDNRKDSINSDISSTSSGLVFRYPFFFIANNEIKVVFDGSSGIGYRVLTDHTEVNAVEGRILTKSQHEVIGIQIGGRVSIIGAFGGWFRYVFIGFEPVSIFFPTKILSESSSYSAKNVSSATRDEFENKIDSESKKSANSSTVKLLTLSAGILF